MGTQTMPLLLLLQQHGGCKHKGNGHFLCILKVCLVVKGPAALCEVTVC